MAPSWARPGPKNWKSTTFTRTRLEPLMTKVLPVSVLLSNNMLLGFLLRYRTLSYLNWPGNGKPLKFEVQNNCLNYDDLCSKMHLLGTLSLGTKKLATVRNLMIIKWEDLQVIVFNLVCSFVKRHNLHTANLLLADFTDCVSVINPTAVPW